MIFIYFSLNKLFFNFQKKKAVWELHIEKKTVNVYSYDKKLTNQKTLIQRKKNYLKENILFMMYS